MEKNKNNNRVLAGTSVQNSHGCSCYSKEKPHGISTKPKNEKKSNIFTALEKLKEH